MKLKVYSKWYMNINMNMKLGIILTSIYRLHCLIFLYFLHRLLLKSMKCCHVCVINNRLSHLKINAATRSSWTLHALTFPSLDRRSCLWHALKVNYGGGWRWGSHGRDWRRDSGMRIPRVTGGIVERRKR